jgi:hypothetical protein
LTRLKPRLLHDFGVRVTSFDLKTRDVALRSSLPIDERNRRVRELLIAMQKVAGSLSLHIAMF